VPRDRFENLEKATVPILLEDRCKVLCCGLLERPSFGRMETKGERGGIAHSTCKSMTYDKVAGDTVCNALWGLEHVPDREIKRLWNALFCHCPLQRSVQVMPADSRQALSNQVYEKCWV
jgi:hypothetical protein